jgi:hypothetical protein
VQLGDSLAGLKPPAVQLETTDAGLKLLDAGLSVFVPLRQLEAGALPSLGDPNVITKLRSMALRVSSQAGVSSPVTIMAVAASDHQAAETVISGAIINDHSPVYVVQMTGGPFTSRLAPPGRAAPQGKVLTFTVDAGTYRLTDIGFDPVAPDLTHIGSVVVHLL